MGIKFENLDSAECDRYVQQQANYSAFIKMLLATTNLKNDEIAWKFQKKIANGMTVDDLTDDARLRNFNKGKKSKK